MVDGGSELFPRVDGTVEAELGRGGVASSARCRSQASTSVSMPTGEPLLRLSRFGCWQVRRVVCEHEGHAVAGGDGELRQRGEVLATQLHRGVQPDGVRTRDRGKLSMVVADPRQDAAVVEPRPQHRLHLDSATEPLDDSDDVGRLTSGRHGVDDAYRAFPDLPLRFQDQGVAAILAAGARLDAGERQPPKPGLLRAVQKCSETGLRVKPR